MSTRVLLVDDHKVFRQALQALLVSEPSIKIVGEAGNGRTAVDLARRLSPDVILMDISMPELNGALATRQILSDSPHIKVIALSMHSDRSHISEMLIAGAAAYLLKTCDLVELVHAIKVVTSDRNFLSPDITAGVVEDYVRGISALAPGASANLSNRQAEVLQLLAEGYTSKEIAHLLHVSVKTATTHRQNIMDKLDIHSVAGLTKYAVREGLTALEHCPLSADRNNRA